MFFSALLLIVLFWAIKKYLLFPTGAFRRTTPTEEADKKFVYLSHGRVAYAHLPAESDRKNEIAVFVHGFSLHSECLRPIAEKVRAQGYDILIFDNYGRGWSDAPDCPQTPSLFISQLAELLYQLNITEPVHLFGLSMGGAISLLFTDTYPDKVRSLTLLASAGLRVNQPSIVKLLFIPVFGELLMRFIGPKILGKGYGRQWMNTDNQLYQNWFGRSLETMRVHPGFLRSVFRTLVDFPMDCLDDTIMKLRDKFSNPICIIWGKQDVLIPVENANLFHRLLSQAGRKTQLFLIDNANHCLMLENTHEVAQAYIEFLGTK